jgi:hypothetical protein
MKFFCGTKGLAQSLTALLLSAGMIFSLGAPARASRSQLQLEPQTTGQSQENKISAATAATATSGVIVQWRSTLDPDNLGFNIYRVQAGLRVRANREIVPGAVFIANKRTLPSDSYSYSWFDRGGTPDSTYYIESVSLRGIAQLDNRPITVTAKSNAAFTQSGEITTASESQAGDAADNSSAQKSFPAAASAIAPVPNGALEDQWSIAAKPGLKIAIKTDGWYRVTQQDMAVAGFNPTVDIRNLRLFGDGLEVAINTSQAIGPFSSGDYIEFYGRGIDVPTSDTRTYYLIADAVAGKRVRGELHVDSATSSSPALLPVTSLPVVGRPSWFGFVWTFLSLPEPRISGAGEVKTVSQLKPAGEPARANAAAPLIDAPATPAPEPIAARSITTAAAPSVKKLLEQPQLPEPSVKIVPRKKKSVRKKVKNNKKTSRHYNHAETTNAIAPASFDYTVEQKDRFNYFLNVLNGDTDNFFGRVLSSLAVNQTLNTPNPQLTGAGPARLEIALQGVSFLSHQVNIQLNNVAIGSLNYYGLDHLVQSFDIPLSLLQNGANTLIFTPVAGGGVSLIDYARITYPHAYRADSDKLRFNLRGTQSLSV